MGKIPVLLTSRLEPDEGAEICLINFTDKIGLVIAYKRKNVAEEGI